MFDRNEFIGAGAAIMAALIVNLFAEATALAADDDPVVLANGNILTMNAKQPTATAMLVRDGKIAAVGDLSHVKPRRVFLSGRVEHVIVEVEVLVAEFPADRLCQRRLAGLTRAMDQHGGTVVEGFDQPWFDQARDDCAGCHCG